MKTHHQERTIFPLRYVNPPEFRAANTTFSTAYTGPEQRRREPRYLIDDPLSDATDTQRPSTVFAA